MPPVKIPGMGLSDVVTKANRIVGKSRSLDAVRGLTTSYGFRDLSLWLRRSRAVNFVVTIPPQ